MQEGLEHALELRLSDGREVDAGDGPVLGGLELPPAEDLVEEVQGDLAGHERDLMPSDRGVEASVAAGLAAGLAVAGGDEVDGPREDVAEPVGVGEAGEVAGATRDGVVDHDESVAGVGFGAGSGEVGLQDPEMRRVTAEGVPEPEEQGCLERQDPLVRLEFRHRQQDPHGFGDELVRQHQVVPLLLAGPGADLAP